MSIIKDFLKDNGYKEEILASSDVKFDSSKIIKAVLQVKDIKEVKDFVQFAANYGLVPYSGNRDCLLFKVIDFQTGKEKKILLLAELMVIKTLLKLVVHDYFLGK